MRYLALACDYDGTLATHGAVPDRVVWALAMLRQSGRRLVLVTGRQLPELLDVFPHIELFDRAVVENGALLYRPADRSEELLGEPVDERLVEALRSRGVDPLQVGRGIIGTWQPHETSVLEAIRERGLEMEIIFNKAAVMVLPSGVNKATGLEAALGELDLSRHNVVGVGDAENDHAFLARVECGIAVANAIEAIRERADHVTTGERGDGVVEVVEGLLADDLGHLAARLARHEIPIGHAGDEPVTVPPYGSNVLLAGPSASGKSTLSTAFMEGLADRGYQFCVIDPEGDYEMLEGAVVLGGQERPPAPDEVLDLLRRQEACTVVNLIGVPVEDRPSFFESLLPELLEARVWTGRPHFLVIDEAHHLMPAQWERAAQTLPRELHSVLFVTVHPEAVAAPVLSTIDTVVAVGGDPADTLRRFGEAAGLDTPADVPGGVDAGQAVWWRTASRRQVVFEAAKSRQERRRHVRKYAEGDLGDEDSFYFTGPEGRLNLKAQNLVLFLQLADGVDDETWRHHLRNGDYSGWFREHIKDDDLAASAEEIERAGGEVDPQESRTAIREAVEARYTLPA